MTINEQLRGKTPQHPTPKAARGKNSKTSKNVVILSGASRAAVRARIVALRPRGVRATAETTNMVVAKGRGISILRLNTEKQVRLEELMDRVNRGVDTPEDDQELTAIADEINRINLHNAKMVAGAANTPNRPKIVCIE